MKYLGISNGARVLSNLVTQVEVDFGTTPSTSKSFTVIASSVTPTSMIVAMQAGDAPTGRSTDENEMDPLLPRAVAGSGSFILYVATHDGPVVGKYKFNYVVG